MNRKKKRKSFFSKKEKEKRKHFLWKKEEGNVDMHICILHLYYI